MTTTKTRSTKAITEFVRTTDKMKLLAKQLRELSAKEQELRPTVLEQIGEERTTVIDGITRTLKRIDEESVIAAKGKDAEILAAAESIGLTISTRTPRYVAPATLRAAVLKGEPVPKELYTIETTSRVVVSVD